MFCEIVSYHFVRAMCVCAVNSTLLTPPPPPWPWWWRERNNGYIHIFFFGALNYLSAGLVWLWPSNVSRLDGSMWNTGIEISCFILSIHTTLRTFFSEQKKGWLAHSRTSVWSELNFLDVFHFDFFVYFCEGMMWRVWKSNPDIQKEMRLSLADKRVSFGEIIRHNFCMLTKLLIYLPSFYKQWCRFVDRRRKNVGRALWLIGFQIALCIVRTYV